MFSVHLDAPTQCEGVAVVVNSRYVNTVDISATEIVQGRAMQVSIQRQGGETRQVLCVYAPTSAGTEEHQHFFLQVLK